MFQNEKIVETRICKHCGASFDITDKDLEFYEKISPVFQRSVSFKETGLNGEKGPDSFFESGLKNLGNGKIKYLIPSPTLCPDCREQRRTSFRNERKLYKRKCDFSGCDIISIYSPDKPYKVYDQNIWWGDNWDPLDYGEDFDFSRGFFEQFGELMKEVPFIGTMNSDSVNSNYSNRIVSMKDTYLVYRGHDVENCLYSSGVAYDNNCIDLCISKFCENCLELVDCRNCYKLLFSSNCLDCSNSLFLDNCIGCNYCFACSNLMNKKYYILNKEYSQEEYYEEIKKFDINNYKNLEKIKSLFKNHSLKFPRRYSFSINSETSLGEYLVDSEDSYFCYDSTGIESCKYILYGVDGVKKSYDCCFIGKNSEMCYEGVSCMGYGNIFSIFMMNCNYVLYSINCHTCSNLFGCIGLRNKSYCILNKQYTKEEYEALVPKIISHMMKTGEWGEFFPSSLSPFGYNETVAQEYYPINTPPIPQKEKGNNSYFFSFSLGGKDDGKADRGTFNWSTYEAPFPKVDKIIPANKLPENIADIPDDILNWAIECEVTKKPFRIIKEELEFYRKHNLPIPRRHPDQRHLERMSLRNPRKLFERICDCPTCEENHKNIGKYKEEEFEINKRTGKKGKRLQTTYAPEREEIVYCEECYNKEVY